MLLNAKVIDWYMTGHTYMTLPYPEAAILIIIFVVGGDAKHRLAEDPTWCIPLTQSVDACV